MTYRFAFEIAFKSDADREDYIKFWEEGSRVIQTYDGAEGTRLHKVVGRNAVFAVAQWQSREAREAAFAQIRADHPDSADRILGENGFDEKYGTVTVYAGGDEIASVFPPQMEIVLNDETS